MAVSVVRYSTLRRVGVFILRSIFGLALAGVGAIAGAQASNPTSATNPFYGSILARPVTDETLKLSIDDAIALGLKNNLGLREAESGEKTFQGEKNQALQEFLPTIRLKGDTGVYQRNLAAQGFGPGVIGQFSKLLPTGQMPTAFSEITRDDLTEGQLQLKQILFSGPVIAGWKAAGAAARSAYFAKMSARGEVVQQVASAYLHAVAAASEVDNAIALESADKVLFDQAHAEHEAGTASNLDELRAQVQFQAQQQARIAAENSRDKDLILLKREIGIDPGQRIVLTDPAPYSELAGNSRGSARRSLQESPGLPESPKSGHHVQSAVQLRTAANGCPA